MSPRRPIPPALFHTLVASAMVGIGLSYGKLYLFHIVLAVYLFSTLRGVVTLPDPFAEVRGWWKRAPSTFFWVVAPLWFAIESLWAQYPLDALEYAMMVGFGSCLFFAIQAYTHIPDVQLREARLLQLFQTFAVCLLVEAVLGLAETTGYVRYPISNFSVHNDWFGRANTIPDEIAAYIDRVPLEQLLTEYSHVPTGFHWHPNDFAVLLAFAFPFLLFAPPRSIAKPTRAGLLAGLGIAIVVYLTTFANARIVFIALAITTFATLLTIVAGWLILLLPSRFLYFPPFGTQVAVRRQLRQSFINALWAAAVVGAFATNLYTFRTTIGSQKLDDMYSLLRRTTGQEAPLKVAESSENIRPQLMRYAVHYAKATPYFKFGLGIGGGNYKAMLLAENGGLGRKHVASLHNHWLEVLLEGGVGYTLLYMVWLCGLGVQLFRTLRAPTNAPFIRYLAASCLLALLGFGLTAVAPSSCVYFLPMYLFYGFAFAVAHPPKTKVKSVE